MVPQRVIINNNYVLGQNKCSVIISHFSKLIMISPTAQGSATHVQGVLKIENFMA